MFLCVHFLGVQQLCVGNSVVAHLSLLVVATRDGSTITQRLPVSQQDADQ